MLHTHLDGIPITIAVLSDDEAASLPPLPEVYEPEGLDLFHPDYMVYEN